MKLSLFLFILIYSTFNLIDLPTKDNVLIIDNPAYDLATTEKFKISKIEVNPTETKIHLQWNMPEGWWVKYGKDTFIRNPETGEKFTVIRLENEEFDSKITIDSTRKHHSVFIFPPIDKGIKKLDYNDQFYGLYINAEKIKESSEPPKEVLQWMDVEFAKNKKAPIEDYEEDAFFSREPAKIVGYIKGYDPKVGFDTGIYYARNNLTREDYPITIEIQPDGKFEAKIPLIHPVKSFLLFNNRMMFFYLEPGQTLGMVLDWKKFLEVEHYNVRYYPQKSIEFEGNLASINTDLSKFQFPEFNYNEFKDNSLNLSAYDFKKYAFDIQEKNEKKLDSFIKINPISKNAELILRNENKLSAVTMVMNYLLNRNYNQKENPENKFLQEKIETAYYSFLQKLPLNTKALLINKQFSEFINRFEYADPLRFVANPKSFTPEVSALDYFIMKNIPLTEKEKGLLKPQDSFTEEYRKEREALGKKYSKEFTAYIKKYYEPFSDQMGIDFMEPWYKKDSVLVNNLHLKNDLVYDIIKTRSLKSDISRISEADKAYKYWNALSETIENDFLINEGKRIVETKFPKAKEYVDGQGTSTAIHSEIITLPDGKGKDQFYDIVDVYKGKILFIDFWATTCGPCVGMIKRMKEIRKKYENNPDFEFVFITDEAQSPVEHYNKFVKEQGMKNIHRVDTDIYNRFRQLFKFNGIPRYVVLNKEGDLIDEDFHMYTFSYELPKILEKYR